MHAATFDEPYYNVVVVGTFVLLFVLFVVIVVSAGRGR